ncbi:MAG: serine/threonine protein kinase [Lentisphaeria bacterium]|nr:serine/threonine protein kinase [Lentisphaeria bacterium]
MKIQCPNCKKITELEHVDHGSQVECVCSCIFTVDEGTVTEEYTDVDSRLPERIGQYPVTGFIGFGGMGKVYLGTHPNLGIQVAIKSLRMEYMTDRASCDRFLQAAKICARINHPNIVRVYDCGYENDNVYLVMEYISGGSAQDLFEQEGKLDPDHAAFIMLEVCSGLMEAEKFGIVHRDIKPENIMFDSEGTVKILDLGLSKIIGDRRINKHSITASLTSLGTPLYMAPEQAVDASNCDSRADIYSIGVSLYQFCTGKLPFESDDPHELRRMHALEKPVPPRQLEPAIRPDMETIILRCMQKKREDRYASIAELACDLEAYLKNHILPSAMRQREAVIHARHAHSRYALRLALHLLRKNWNRSRQHPRILWSSIAAALLLAAVAVFLAFKPAEPIRRKLIPVTGKQVLARLSRQAAQYAADQNFAAVEALYLNYRGPCQEETLQTRRRIAEGHRLTRKQLSAELRLTLAGQLLGGHPYDAWKTYCERNGKYLCPENEGLLRSLAENPETPDLESARTVLAGIRQLKRHQPAKAQELFKTVPGLGSELARLVNDPEAVPGSGTDSDRSR